MLTPGYLLKKHDLIRTYFVSLGLTTAERDAAFYLLRLYAYYGKVYPKAPNYTEDCYRSKRSFWRAVAKLEEFGLLDRINRFLHHLQISNAYRLDKLVLCLVRYLAEHGCPYFDKFTTDIINKTTSSFWRTIGSLRVRLRDPIPITAMV
jgi:TorA maturation chaperone TorD